VRRFERSRVESVSKPAADVRLTLTWWFTPFERTVVFKVKQLFFYTGVYF
jgi:hypothetical protein